MRLTDIFTGEKPVKESNSGLKMDSAQAAAISRQIRSMVPGQTITGEIVAKNKGDLQIKLANDFLLNARLEQSMNLELGKIMTFEVRNNGKALTLSPLFANTATDANTLKALDMAMLPVNETTVEMTDKMMEAGMSIDRNSLQQMYREVNAFMDAEIRDIIDLHKMGVPVNEENLEQLSNYRNLNHQLIGSVNDIAEALPQLLEKMAQDSGSDIENAARILLQVLDPDSVMQGENMELSKAEGTQVRPGQENVMENIPLHPGEEGVQAQSRKETAMPGGKVLIKDISLPEEADKTMEAQKMQEAESPALPHPAGANIRGLEEWNRLADAFLSLKGEEKANFNPGQLLHQAGEILKQALESQDHESVKRLLANPALKEIAKEGLQREWTIKPEDAADKERMEEFYKKLTRQVKNLAQTLEAAGQTNTNVYKAVSNVSQNVDFLHQVNQMYAYVQLPLKLSQGDAHGDLYVYTNKRNLSAKDGKISALLHLDMQYLGPLDVYVALENTNVSTNFYLKDESMLDFMMDHMDILTKRLEKRGYSCSCSMKVKGEGEEKESGIGPVLKKEGHVALSQFAFDVRA